MEEKKKKRSNLLLIIGLILGIFLLAFFSINNWYKNSINGEFNSKAFELIVEEGDTFLDVVNYLSEAGYINSTIPIQIYLRTERVSPNIKVGTYEIPAGYTVPELITTLEEGTFKPAIWVTIKEGLKYEDVSSILGAELAELTQFSEAEFFELVEDPSQIQFSDQSIRSFLDNYLPEGKPLRGFLYPDTYRIDQGMTTAQIIEIMVKNFKVKVEENIGSFSSPSGNINNLYEAVILASVIEKEASAWDDRSEISSVFHNRMSDGIALQSDATVNFITGKSDAGVTLVDQQIDSPYNTYIYPGLMPTPINNPRIESIDAALNPKDTEFYFFYHTPDGQTFFNVDYDSHLVGVCRDLGC